MTERKIPAGAIKIPLPDLQQPENYSCGLALMSIAKYFGLGPDNFSEPKEEMGTTEKDGTYYGDILKYALDLGLDAEVKTEMTRDDLKKLLDEKIPVLISMQAFALDPEEYDDPDLEENGHYIVAIGYDDEDYFYFMDPSIICQRGYLSWADFDKRWHENERGEERSHHLGIICRPNGHEPVHQTVAVEIP